MAMMAVISGVAGQLTSAGTVDVVVDIPSTVMVVLAFVATLAGVWFAVRFSRTGRWRSWAAPSAS